MAWPLASLVDTTAPVPLASLVGTTAPVVRIWLRPTKGIWPSPNHVALSTRYTCSRILYRVVLVYGNSAWLDVSCQVDGALLQTYRLGSESTDTCMSGAGADIGEFARTAHPKINTWQ